MLTWLKNMWRKYKHGANNNSFDWKGRNIVVFEPTEDEHEEARKRLHEALRRIGEAERKNPPGRQPQPWA